MSARHWLLLGLAALPPLAQAQVTSGVKAFATAAPLITGPTTTLANLDSRIVVVPPNISVHSAAAHADGEELIIVKDGSLRATVNGHSRVLGPGSVVVVMPDDGHELMNAGTTPLTAYVFAYRSKSGADSVRSRKAGGSFFVDWNDVVFNKTGTGGVRRIFDRATSSLERFEMHVSTLNTGLTNHPAHTHGAEELVVVLRGDVRMLIGDSYQTAKAGDVIFLASRIPHSLDNIGSVPAEYFAFQWY